MSATKKRKEASEKEAEEVEEGEAEIVYLNKLRGAHTDLILCSSTIDKVKNEKKTIKFQVEKAVLACHSSTFLNMFTDCSTQDKENVAEISIPEPAKVVSSFLHIIYATFQERNEAGDGKGSFDHWVDVIEMGDKYLANVVVERSIFNLCSAFRSLAVKEANVETFSQTRYGKAAFLKLIVIFSLVANGRLGASHLSENELIFTIKHHWRDFCTQCGINFDKRPCGCQHNYAICCGIKQSLCSLETLLPDEAAGYFDVRDIVAFQKVIEDIPHKYDIIEVVERHFLK
ncbi:uncharacterized protein FA14DRAFT_184165 [Meira miltonrushii]|uniref:BTB domain-containing protein n=1 Tax=Meira miltonrushii TaxID=1280837 RepID=A0A316VAZ4_9BASI|nr:uncharacterized protein FA14DRAFT_184165 [Meira miltonrushii]PWN34692.1 hypothetical protein FA14DRAFT_184165 [Meira miltonrushii]